MTPENITTILKENIDLILNKNGSITCSELISRHVMINECFKKLSEYSENNVDVQDVYIEIFGHLKNKIMKFNEQLED